MSDKNPHAVALGRLGGKTVTEKKRAHLARIAKAGAAARWRKAKAVATAASAGVVLLSLTTLAAAQPPAPPTPAPPRVVIIRQPQPWTGYYIKDQLGRPIPVTPVFVIPAAPPPAPAPAEPCRRFFCE